MRKLHRTAISLAGLALAAGTALSAAPPAGAATTALMVFPTEFSEGIIEHSSNGACIEPSHEDFFGNGDPVVQRRCDNSAGQVWQLVPVGKRTFDSGGLQYVLPASHIVNAATGLCLDDRDGVSSDGATVQQWECNNTSTTMIWGTWGDITTAFPIINLRASNKAHHFMVLEVASRSNEVDVPLQLFTQETPPPNVQRWFFLPDS